MDGSAYRNIIGMQPGTLRLTHRGGGSIIAGRLKGTAMRALHLVGPRRFNTITTPVPALPPGSRDAILVRPDWLSLCGSDIPFFRGNKRFLSYPMAPGAPVHECV